MRELRRGARLPLETLATLGLVSHVIGQHLQRDAPPEPYLVREVNFAHASPAEEADNSIRSQGCTGGEAGRRG